MGNLLGAFEKIAVPQLAGLFAQRAGVMLKKLERNKEAERPDERVGNFLLDYPRQRGSNLDGAADLLRNPGKLLESIGRAFGVYDVAAQKSAATIKLEIEIPSIVPGPGE